MADLATIGLAVATLGILALVALIAVTLPGIPRVPDELNRLIAVPPTEIYASDGSLLTRVGGRKAVPLDRISESFQRAVLATEDDEFYLHRGIDKPALVKATLLALSGSRSRGGSTISQQLARNLFFTFEKTYARKFVEILATLEIEARFSKDEILNGYCNGIYFGNYAYGVEEAATSYFGKHASNLNLAEAALLAGLPQSPSRFNPYKRPELAIAKQSYVLGRMRKLEWIETAEYSRAMAAELVFRPLYASADEGSYFLDAVLDGLEEDFGKNILYYGGLKIYTTLDPALQSHAIRAVREGLADLDNRLGLPPFSPTQVENRANYPQASLVGIESATGAVQTLVGGRDWQASQFNRAVRANRNMGSVLKPALYLVGIENLGIHPATLAIDSSLVILIPGTTPWSPKNFEPGYRGQTTLKYSLEHSINTVAARLIYAVGPESMVQTLYRLGVTTRQRPHYSLSLGGTTITAVELAGIGAAISNLGEVVEPYLIRRIEDARGHILQEHIVSARPAFDPEAVYLLVDMMKGVFEEGTARSASRYGFTLPAIGKTGTTDDYRDSWFLGSTPRFSTAVWVGFDDNRQMRNANDVGITGATGALPIWARFMVLATEGEPPRDFPVPPGIRFEIIDPVNGITLPSDRLGGMRVAMPTDASMPDSTLLRFEHRRVTEVYGTVEQDSLTAVTRTGEAEVTQ